METLKTYFSRFFSTLWEWIILAVFSILIGLVWVCNRGKRGLWDDEGKDYEVRGESKAKRKSKEKS